MRHLTTEELLLHCDDALAPELAVHVRECISCHHAWLNLQEVLCEAEEAIRSGVPGEPQEHRVASRRALEAALYAAKEPAGFRLRWSAVYAVAAALTFTVIGGFLQSRHDLLEAPSPQFAATRQLAGIPANPLTEPAAVSSLPGQQALQPVFPDVVQPAVAQLEPTAIASPATVSIELPQDIATQTDAAAIQAAIPQETIQTPSSNEIELARVEAPKLNTAAAKESQAASIETPRVPVLTVSESANTTLAVANAPIPAELTATADRTAEPSELLLADFDRNSVDSAALPKLVEGYWILTQARVWQEDLRPVMTVQGLRIEGTVEDSAARHRIEAALRRQSIQGEAISVRLRRDLSDATPRSNGSARVIRAVYSGPAGGPVRRALLGHFSDAARRSFVAPGASALEGEMVRYVSEIYRNQSELLAHVYALQGFLGRMDAEQLASAGQPTTRKFRDVVRFHLQGIDEKEAAIYDRLSEALPRKVWSHRGDAAETEEGGNWRDESNNLLRETLELDSNLTALFGGSSLTVDAADPDQSCGELLNRIRTRIRRIKSRTQAL